MYVTSPPLINPKSKSYKNQSLNNRVGLEWNLVDFFIKTIDLVVFDTRRFSKTNNSNPNIIITCQRIHSDWKN